MELERKESEIGKEEDLNIETKDELLGDSSSFMKKKFGTAINHKFSLELNDNDIQPSACNDFGQNEKKFDKKRDQF